MRVTPPTFVFVCTTPLGSNAGDASSWIRLAPHVLLLRGTTRDHRVDIRTPLHFEPSRPLNIPTHTDSSRELLASPDTVCLGPPMGLPCVTVTEIARCHISARVMTGEGFSLRKKRKLGPSFKCYAVPSANSVLAARLVFLAETAAGSQIHANTRQVCRELTPARPNANASTSQFHA